MNLNVFKIESIRKIRSLECKNKIPCCWIVRHWKMSFYNMFPSLRGWNKRKFTSLFSRFNIFSALIRQTFLRCFLEFFSCNFTAVNTRPDHESGTFKVFENFRSKSDVDAIHTVSSLFLFSFSLSLSFSHFLSFLRDFHFVFFTNPLHPRASWQKAD